MSRSGHLPGSRHWSGIDPWASSHDDEYRLTTTVVGSGMGDDAREMHGSSDNVMSLGDLKAERSFQVSYSQC